MKVGERALAMARVFNHREGFTAADDKTPPTCQTGYDPGKCSLRNIPLIVGQQIVAH